ncbi:MAG: nuclear transport factor 2 family protein [Pseudomonadota bacterium]|nr:nuclear transport factor 2 family protein [Pseudomonadota bacterium]
MCVKTPTVHELAAKQAITEVIHRYCRGMDRMDKDLTLSCWHPGGTDDHAPLYSGLAEGFVEWLWPVHAAMLVTRHVVSNTLIELNGEKAGAETYWSLALRVPHDNALLDIIAGGRYLDRFECIDEIWAIRHRQSILDWERVQPVDRSLADFTAPPLIPPNNPEAPVLVPSRNRNDPSYQLIGGLSNGNVPVGNADRGASAGPARH